MFNNALRLSDSVGSDRHVEEEDTLKTKNALQRLGRYDTPEYGMTPYPDAAMFNAIGKFQKERNLYQDRIMNPGGETETAMNKELGRVGSNSELSPTSYHPGGEISPGEMRCQEIRSQAERAKANFLRTGDQRYRSDWLRLEADHTRCTMALPKNPRNRGPREYPKPPARPRR